MIPEYYRATIRQCQALFFIDGQAW